MKNLMIYSSVIDLFMQSLMHFGLSQSPVHC